MDVTQWADLPLVLTSDQAAAVLQLKRRTIANMLDRGDLYGIKVGKEWRVSRTELMRFVEGGGSAGIPAITAPALEAVPALVDQGGVLVAQVEPITDLVDFVKREHDLRVADLVRQVAL
jgi:excisionase family DNA binding protein